jgi:adenosylhomocysteine nucleosidase
MAAFRIERAATVSRIPRRHKDRILKVLVTFAVEPEFTPWRKFRKFLATTVNGITVYSSEMGGTRLDVVLTGMGPANARRAAESVTSANAYAICISSGFAGALKAEHKVGEVLVAETVQRVGEINRIRCDGALVRDAAKGLGAKKVAGFLTSENIVESAEEKAALAKSGDAVDMESFAILSVAEDRGVPAIAIRAVSDRFDQIIPMDFSGSIDQCGHVLKGKLARDIMNDPRKIPALIRLGRQSSVASERLTKFLEGYVERLSMQEFGETRAGLERVAQS